MSAFMGSIGPQCSLPLDVFVCGIRVILVTFLPVMPGTVLSAHLVLFESGVSSPVLERVCNKVVLFLPKMFIEFTNETNLGALILFACRFLIN